MKNILITTVLLASLGSAYSQSWQWAKRGGGDDTSGSFGGYEEEVYDVVTDSNKNIYVLSRVTQNGLDIDGHPKTNFDTGYYPSDIAIASFSCSGAYRWSKIIGGFNHEEVKNLKIDAQNNIYVAGKFGGCGDYWYPPRIDDDVILPQTTEDCSLLFVAKFNADGVMLWFQRPQPPFVDLITGYSSTYPLGSEIDSAGNLYWAVILPPGTYGGGAFVTTMPSSSSGYPIYILKYDTNGNFVSGTNLNMILTYDFALNLKIYRNPYNGYFYFTSDKNDNATAVVAGNTVTHAAFMACYNSVGQFQWLRESTATSGGALNFYGLAFDSQNNIYVGMKLVGNNLDSFIGFSIPQVTDAPPVVLKLNPNATAIIFSSNCSVSLGASNTGAIALKDNEIGLVNHCALVYSWGNQTINVGTFNQGLQPLLVRLNKDTGACIGLHNIPNALDGTNDLARSVTTDVSGDYIVGGSFGHILNVNGTQLLNSGSETDFFVAKFATEPCSPLATESFEKETLKVYPNPVATAFAVGIKENSQYELFTVTGVLVAKGNLTVQQNSINIGQLASGCYLLHLLNEAGNSTVVKVLKE